ncbi:hypothetical protein ACIQNI_30830 [Streptomyces sp. NPDC091266]|uniref:hypothetical protein n=1 Tax=Streptomyces sp. NPDC091266 TaxID=3365978 RepID=UPI0038284238
MTLVEREHGYVVLARSSGSMSGEFVSTLISARPAAISFVACQAGSGSGRTEQLGAWEPQKVLQDGLVVTLGRVPQLAVHPPVERAPGNKDPGEVGNVGLPCQVTRRPIHVAGKDTPVVPLALLD